jgi:hypothetical protein
MQQEQLPKQPVLQPVRVQVLQRVRVQEQALLLSCHKQREQQRR